MDLNKLSYDELNQLEKNLKTEILTRRKNDEAKLVEDIRAKAAQLGLSADDLIAKLKAGPVGKSGKPKGAAVFVHPETRAHWSGRGRKPRWVEAWLESGRSLDELRA